MIDEVKKEKLKDFGLAVCIAIFFFTMLFTFIMTVIAIMERSFTPLVIVSMIVLFLGLVYMFYFLLRK